MSAIHTPRLLPGLLILATLATVTACSNDKPAQEANPAANKETAKAAAPVEPTPIAKTEAKSTPITPVDKLGSYTVDIQQTSVSGLSSGAFMTSQLYIAHSDIMVGAGVIAGGPYLCSLSWPTSAPAFTATTTCMQPINSLVEPNLPRLEKQTRKLSDDGQIDPISNLASDRIYLFSGQSDEVVYSAVMDSTRQYFIDMGVPESAISYDNNVNAGHAIITNDPNDLPCEETESPYINNCNFMQSQRLITHIYGNTQPAAETTTGELIEFDQTEFLPDDVNTYMSDTAYAYVPSSCKGGEECRIHVAIHGCGQNYEFIGEDYFQNTGYNEMADSNKLIILYPQVSKSSNFDLHNPLGCWDFWGYSARKTLDPDFYTREAPQIQAIYKMIQRLAGTDA